MRHLIRNFLALGLLICCAGAASANFVYDFPGVPGSGLAANQTNPQSPNATFGDFGRVSITATPTADVFESDHWNNTAVFDPASAYAFFDITAASGYHLNLSGTITFDTSRGPGGPTKGRVQLFLNGSTTPYATKDWNPGPSLQNISFNFTPTTDADNVTSVEVRFYGWNGGDPLGTMLLDNVTTTMAIIPEPSTIVIGVLPIALMAWSALKRRRNSERH